MRPPYVDNNGGVGRDEVPIILVIRDAASRDTQRRRIVPPQKLFHHRVYIGKCVSVCKGREPVGADDAVEFGSGFLLDFGVEGERRKEALQGGKLL